MTKRERHKAWRDLSWDASDGGHPDTRERVREGLPVGFPLREGEFVETVGERHDLGLVDEVQGTRVVVHWLTGEVDDIDATTGRSIDFDFWVRRAPFQQTAARFARVELRRDVLRRAMALRRERQARWLTIEQHNRHRWVEVIRTLRAVLKLPLGAAYECVQGRRALPVTLAEVGALRIRLQPSLATYTIHDSEPSVLPAARGGAACG